jgi:hypothetical protein
MECTNFRKLIITREDKQLLLQDLCARLPYGVQVCYKIHLEDEPIDVTLSGLLLDYFKNKTVVEIKPYLRSMSSMTEEERNELVVVCNIDYIDDKIVDFGEFLCEGSPVNIKNIYGLLDWLNFHHFDYRGLIEKGLALEAPEGMYKI